MTLSEKMYDYISQHPGCRQRNIASACHVWLCSSEFLMTLHDLKREGKIRDETYSDPANMEYYNKWYVVN